MDDKLVNDALAVVEGALRSPPDGADEERPVLDALKVLMALGDTKSVEPLFALARSTAQPDPVRGHAFVALASAPGRRVKDLRSLLLPILGDPEGPPSLRQAAAVALGKPGLANAAVREALLQALLRPRGDGVVQRACLRGFAETAPIAEIQSLVLRPAVYEHPYFGIRADVCCALAALGVRSSRSLELLCRLLEDADPADRTFLVPQEALLSYWSLTGRIYGVSDRRLFQSEPTRIQIDQSNRQRIWDFSFVRPGVSRPMVEVVQSFTCSNFGQVVAARARGDRVAWVRNAQGLRAAAAAARKDIDAIAASWK